MNNIPSTTIIGWETRSWRHRDKAILWCKNYGLKPVMKNVYLGPLYEKERRAIRSFLNSLFVKKTEKIFISSICQSCVAGLDVSSQEKARSLPAFEIVQLSKEIRKIPKKGI